MSNQLKMVSATRSESVELIRNFLKDHHSGVLGTSDLACNPHVAVIYYEVDDDFRIVFATKTETQKAKNMLKNQQVAFAVYDEAEQITIQITGRVDLIKNSDEKRHAENIMFKNSSNISKREYAPAEKLLAGDMIAFQLTPLVIRMGIFARPVSSEEEYYETLLFSEESTYTD